MRILPQALLEFAFFAAIAVAVGGFGGTARLPWGVVEILILLLGLCLVLRTSPHSPPTPYRRLLCFPVGFIGWIALQWFASRAGLVASDPYAIETRGLDLVVAIVAFFLALEIARARDSCRRFFLFLIALGVFEALYGLAEYLAGWNYIWNVPRIYYLAAASGTFVNHNDYAGFLEMVLPLSLALALYQWRKSRRRSRRSFSGLFEFLGDPLRVKALLLLLAATLMLVSIVFSFSRMGMISTVVSLALIAAVAKAGGSPDGIAGRRRGGSPAPAPLRAALIVAFLAAAVGVVIWLGVGPVVQHFELLPQNDPLAAAGGQGRMALWSEALPLLRSHPWFGVGLGGFQYAFTRLQDMQLTYVFDYAHNDYLQFSIELGIPCAVLLFALIFWVVLRTLQTGLRARSGLTRAFALGSLGGASALLVHSAADFNLYIPANAVVFASLLGLGYAQWLEVSAERAAADRAIPSRAPSVADPAAVAGAVEASLRVSASEAIPLKE
jgi:O-antigen ligase